MYYFLASLEGSLLGNVEKPLMCAALCSTTTTLGSTQNVLLSPRKTISFNIFPL